MKSLKSYFLKLGVIALIFAWLMSGWPVIWQNPRIPPEIQKAQAATEGNARTYYMDSTLSSPNQLRTREYASSTSSWGSESTANQTTNTTINNIVVEASPTRDEKLIGVWSDTATANQSEFRVFRWDGSLGDETLIFSTTVGADLGTNTRPFDIAYEYASGDALIVYSNGGTTNEISYFTWNGTATSSISTQELAGTSAAVTNIILTPRATSTSDRIAMIYAVNASTNALNAAVWNGSSWESNPSTAIETGSAFAATTSIALAIDWEDVSGEILAVWDTTAVDNVFRFNTCTGGPPCTWGTTANSGTAESMTVGALARRFGTNELFLVMASNNGNDTGAARWSGSAWTLGATLDGTNGDPDATLGQEIAAGWLEAGGAVRAIGVYGDAAAAGLDYVQWNGSSLSLGTDLCTTGPPSTIEKQIRIKQNPFAKDWLLVMVKDANADVYSYKVTFDGTNLGCSYLGMQNANVGVNTNRSFDFDYDRFVPPPTFNQSAYRFFNNTDSTDVGTALAAQDTAATLGSTGAAFRLRMLLHVGVNQLVASGQSFKLQFAQRGADNQCDTSFSGETYADVTAATVIAYNDNATPADGASLTANANDPTHGADTIVNQTYEELNNFTNSVAAIPSGQDGKWDFSLKDNGATANTAYCFRAVKSDGTVLDTYSVIPQITTASVVATVSCSTNVSSTSFGTVNSSSVFTASPNASTTMSCSGTSAGCTLYVKDAGSGSQPGLWNSTSSILIPSPNAAFSATSTLTAGTAGYGIQATTTASGLTIAARYNQTGNTVGGLATTTIILASSTADIASSTVTITHKAAVSADTLSGAYNDTITYSCTVN